MSAAGGEEGGECTCGPRSARTHAAGRFRATARRAAAGWRRCGANRISGAARPAAAPSPLRSQRSTPRQRRRAAAAAAVFLFCFHFSVVDGVAGRDSARIDIPGSWFALRPAPAGPERGGLFTTVTTT